MRILVSHATDSNFREELYEPLKHSALSQHELIFPEEFGPENINREFIKTCDLVIAECSIPSTGQGIELGWADSFVIPILCIYKQDAKISGALHYLTKNVFAYKNTDDMIDKISDFIVLQNN